MLDNMIRNHNAWSAGEGSAIVRGAIHMYSDRVEVDGKIIDLRKQEMMALRMLMKRQAVQEYALIDTIWKNGSTNRKNPATTENVAIIMTSLRKKIGMRMRGEPGSAKCGIEKKRGYYRLAVDEEEG